jgi:branched-chain amino acid transport system substrate-binding protein
MQTALDRRRHGNRRLAVAWLALVPMLVAACGGGGPGSGRDSAVGVTGSTITVSVSSAFSGVYGPVVAEFFKGWETWRDEVNAHGGIHGRKVVLKTVDGQNTAEGGVAACKQILSNGSFTAVNAGSLFTTDTDCLDQAGYPSLYATAARRLSGRWRHSYQIASGFDDEGATLASFVKDVMGDGDKKLGVIYVNQGSFVDTSTAYVAMAKRSGMNVVDVEVGEPNQASFTPQLLHLREAGAENVAVIAAVEAMTVMRDAKALGYQPHWTGGRGITNDAIVLAARDLYRGIRGLRPTAAADSPAFKAYEEKARTYGHVSRLPGLAFAWYGEALALGKALDAAGPRPTRARLVDGIESVKGFDTGVIPTITWGPGDYYGAGASFPMECCSADWSWKGTGAPKAAF